MSTKQWSRSWKQSSTPAKQRKYRENAAAHHRQKFLNARLDDSLQEKVGTTSLPVRDGDRVEVCRGDFAGERGKIRAVDTETYRVEIEGVDRETVSGSETRVSINPSNLVIVKLNLDDERRVAKYDVTEAEMDDISVEPDEPADEDAGDEDAEDEGDEPSAEEADDEVDYSDVVEGTVAEVKEQVEADNLDPAAALTAEKNHKERKTLIEWLERRVDDA